MPGVLGTSEGLFAHMASTWQALDGWARLGQSTRHLAVALLGSCTFSPRGSQVPKGNIPRGRLLSENQREAA